MKVNGERGHFEGESLVGVPYRETSLVKGTFGGLGIQKKGRRIVGRFF